MKKSFRQAYWFASSIFKKYSTIIIVSLVVGIIATLNMNRIIQFLPRSNTTYIGRAGSYTLSQLPLDIQHLISSGLTAVDSTGKPIPDIAQSWNIQESGKKYQFTLDPNKYWQDGTNIITSDIDINLKDVSIEIINDHSLAFNLKDPFSPFPVVVSQPVFKKINYRKFLFFKRTKIIGTNDYSITNIKTSSGIITELTLKSRQEKIVYRFYPTEEEVVTAFMLGKVDQIDNISSTKSLSEWKNLTLTREIHTDRYVAIFFNTQDPSLSNKSIRQALAYGIPKDTFKENRALSPINPLSWAYNPQVKPYKFDIATAQDLIDKNTSPESGPMSITLSTTQAFIDLAELIKSSWEDLGIEVNIRIVNFPDTSDYQVLLIGQQIPIDPDQYTYWHSTQGTNFTRYNSPRVDKLLEDGRKTLDEDERTLIYQDFQRFITEDSPAIFLYHLDSYHVERN